MSTYARKRRRRHLLPITLLVAVAYLAGLVWFLRLIPGEVAEGQQQPTEAIVVLTGGGGRIAEGLDLLAREQGQKLFISGVYRGVDVQQLLQLAQRQPDEMLCCITLGYEAQDTAGNAEETAAWITDQGYRSLTLVTSAHHMPRSLLEFHAALPDAEVLPHPVQRRTNQSGAFWHWGRAAYAVFSEYNKYLLTRLRLALQDAYAKLKASAAA